MAMETIMEVPDCAQPTATAAIDFGDLRHDLMNPLATIRGRAQLLVRAIERSNTIDDDERTRLLRGLAAIELAVLTAVNVLEDAESQHEAQLDGSEPSAGPRS
ncbi:MAG: hypothetical protein QM692_03445 [Thermomicrobiales bacterium]